MTFKSSKYASTALFWLKSYDLLECDAKMMNSFY